MPSVSSLAVVSQMPGVLSNSYSSLISLVPPAADLKCNHQSILLNICPPSVLSPTLVEFNQTWAAKAAVLIVIVSHDVFDSGKPARTHSFDTGAAWQNLALQGSKAGLVVHGMEGFDYARAKEELGIPSDYTVEAMVAVGKPGKVEDLPKELQEKEQMSDRKPLNEIVFQGAFGKQ